MKRWLRYIISHEIAMKIKSQVDDISYILSDDGLDVRCFLSSAVSRRVGSVFMSGNEYVVINIVNNNLNASDRPVSGPTDKIDWLSSLAFNDSFIEFIDRVNDVCKPLDCVIFVEQWPSKARIRKYNNTNPWHNQSGFYFDKLYIATKERPPNHIPDFIDVKHGIKSLRDKSNPESINTLVGNGLSWINKKIDKFFEFKGR